MEQGREMSLETALYGFGERYDLWCTHMNKWVDKHETNINAPPRTADDKWWWAEFGSVAIVLGLTTAAAVTTSLGGAAAAFPVAAVGHLVWTVRKVAMLGVGAQSRLMAMPQDLHGSRLENETAASAGGDLGGGKRDVDGYLLWLRICRFQGREKLPFYADLKVIPFAPYAVQQGPKRDCFRPFGHPRGNVLCFFVGLLSKCTPPQ